MSTAAEHSVKRSMDLYERASELIPGATQLASRRASAYASGVSPTYAESAKGSRFVDSDGNEYIDHVNAFTAVILGHADEVVNSAVKEQVDKGSIFTVNSPLEIELAEELVDTIPSAEMVRFAKGGGDACAVAVRIARGATGRDKVLICGYHGWHDWYVASNYVEDLGREPIGVPKALAGTAIPFPDGDLDTLERRLVENRGEVAAIIMEPMRTDPPADGYLEAVKELARAHDVVLIFDEVSCGWRISLGGAQEYLGVTPDMTVVAKAMSNGYAMGAVVGSRDVMEPAGRMFISSSYWSDNIGLAASITTIRELRRRDSTNQFRVMGEKLRAELNEAIDSVGIAARCEGAPTNLSITFDLPDESLTPKVTTLFTQEMARRGVFASNRFNITLAHTEDDFRETAQAAAGSLEVVRTGLEGSLDDLLAAGVMQEPFRRLVR